MPAPLPFLLSSILADLERAYAHQAGTPSRLPSLDLWANLLRALTEAGIERSDLPTLLRVSKRALRMRISTAKRHGWIEERKSGRAKAIVRLTGLGSEVAALSKSRQQSVEEQWRAKVGFEKADRLRFVLEKIVAALPLEHPHYPASYGAADASITGGHGQDWRPVLRKSPDTLSHLPFSALLSQLLVAFAIDYEELSPVALSLSTNIIMEIPANGCSANEIGNSIGVSALVRHGFLSAPAPKDGQILFLTAKGRAVRDAYQERVQQVESFWRERFGAPSATELRQTLEAVVIL